MKTKIIHHPDAELLASYAAANLPLSRALCVSAHLEQCALCRQQLRALNGLGGQLLQQLKPSAPPTALREKVLAQINNRNRQPSPPPAPEANSTVPRCLRQFVREDYQSLKWRRLTLGMRIAELCRDGNGAKVQLLRVKPGASVAAHTHLGNEFIVVLEGSFSDESGLYQRGDFAARDARHKHAPVATRDGECICLLVTEAPLHFTGFFGRLLNPLVRRSHHR